MLHLPIALSADGQQWTDEILAQVDTATSATLIYPYDATQATRWNVTQDHPMTFEGATGLRVTGFGKRMHVRLFSGADALEAELPVYFVPGCQVPLVGLELLDTYFDLSTAGGEWELTVREHNRSLTLPIRDDLAGS